MAPHLKKVVRVFVSSTFRDFVRERDVLGKVVFPRLRKFCSGLGLSLTEVDLRWGVTDEMLQKGETITTCLSEVTLCAPFFIGLLGERYGWHLPPEEETDAKSGLKTRQASHNDVLLTQALDAAERQFPLVGGYRDRSVTELEIRHALQLAETRGNDDAKRCIFFYLRDPGVASQVPEGERGLYSPESDYAGRRLGELKRDLRASGCATLDGYSDLDILGERIYQDLCGAIKGYFPAPEEMLDYEQRRQRHLAHAAILSNFFAGRREVLAKLTDHVSSTVKYGKSCDFYYNCSPTWPNPACLTTWPNLWVFFLSFFSLFSYFL